MFSYCRKICLMSIYEKCCILAYVVEIMRLKKCFFHGERWFPKQAGNKIELHTCSSKAVHSEKPSLLTDSKYHILMARHLPVEGDIVKEVRCVVGGAQRL